jgi:hypothetical protein
MILLDWTRMGKTYCLAGVILDDLDLRVVRPLLWRGRAAPVRNIGWSPLQFDGHTRWELIELVGARAAAPDPPHHEDVWVRDLRLTGKLATPEQRRLILAATAAVGGPLFGAGLEPTRTAAYLQPGAGKRSLATAVVPAGDLRFGASWRDGADEPDIRVTFPVAELGERVLPVKDHHLLTRAQRAGADLDRQLAALREAVRGMGERVAVRLGLSRPFQYHDGQGAALCWLMADGFFSLADPQP